MLFRSDAILGAWEGHCTSAGSVFDDGKEHRWSYHADGSYVYYVKDGDSWVPSTNTLNEYFVAGNLLCTRWVDNGVENREWWEITIDGDTMTWTALREDENGSKFTATFEMTRVESADNEGGLLGGMWMLADKDGVPALTNEKGVLRFVSPTEAYASASLNSHPELGAVWLDLKEIEPTIEGNKLTIVTRPTMQSTVQHEYTITAINADEFFADLSITANGTEILADNVPVRFTKVNADYSADIVGVWEGKMTSEQSKFGDVKEHRWEYRSDGTYVFSMKNADGEWVPVEDAFAEYFVAGNLLCTRWKNAGEGKEENREWWEITIDGDTMNWTALRRGDDGSTYTATFEMVRVSGAAADNAELVEQIKAFQTEHPEYKTAYHDILDQTDLILREELSTAFKAVQEEWKDKIMAQEEENGIPVEERQRFAGLCETMAFIINRDFIEHYKSVFVLDDPEYFDGSGEAQGKITADYDEAYQAIAEQFSAFIAERGGNDGKAKELFNGINYSISREMDAAFDRANGRLKESIEEIAEAYGFSDEDKAFVSSVITGLMKDVNANFMSIYTSNKMESFDPEIAINK